MKTGTLGTKSGTELDRRCATLGVEAASDFESPRKSL